jgi:hypothetical protein
MTGLAHGAPADGALDHVVINVLRRMDEAADLFAALGFRLTPRGYHSLGSINHLMMTAGPYLELVGVPETGAQRQDVLDSPFGLNGLVVASRDADATHARLAAAGLAAGPPVAFSRPVTVEGRAAEARFRTARVPAHLFPAGRLYHCEHLTPDLVWRPEWFDHPNGFSGIDALTIESPAPEADAALYATASGAPAEAAGGVWTLRLGETAITIVPGPVARFAALALRFRDLDALEARAGALPEVSWVRPGPDVATLTLPVFGLRLSCRADP